MNTTMSTPLSLGLLIDPAAALAAAARIAQSDLPRRICRPLDRRMAVPVSAEVAAYDADVDETSFTEEDESELPLAA